MSKDTHTIEVKIEGLAMAKLQETLASKRFQALAIAVLCTVGAYLSKSIDIGAMWDQVRIALGVYVASIVVVQAPAETAKALSPVVNITQAADK